MSLSVFLNEPTSTLILIHSLKHEADAVIGRNAERLDTASKEMEKLSGRRCIPAPADGCKPAQLKEAVEKTIATLEELTLSFAVRGGVDRSSNAPLTPSLSFASRAGAAGNFLAPISKLSENGFRTVIEIDTVRARLCRPLARRVGC